MKINLISTIAVLPLIVLAGCGANSTTSGAGGGFSVAKSKEATIKTDGQTSTQADATHTELDHVGSYNFRVEID